MRELIGLFGAIQIRDVVDILLVAGFFYLIFSMLRETRSAAALRGLVTVLVGSLLAYFLARLFSLKALLLLFEVFWVVVVLVFIIVFQHDFRRSLTQIGQLRMFRQLFTRSGQYLDEVVSAVGIMSRRRVGALMAFERRNALRVYSETGTRVDARVTAEFIRTIFTAHTPLHDGGVIICDAQVLAAGCLFPLSQDTSINKELGTRHRAALGLSEESDAVVVVVSEETGIITTAVHGVLKRGLSVDELRDFLISELDVKPEEDANV